MNTKIWIPYLSGEKMSYKNPIRKETMSEMKGLKEKDKKYKEFIIKRGLVPNIDKLWENAKSNIRVIIIKNKKNFFIC